MSSISQSSHYLIPHLILNNELGNVTKCVETMTNLNRDNNVHIRVVGMMDYIHYLKLSSLYQFIFTFQRQH